MQTVMPGVAFQPLFPVDQMNPLPDGPVPTVLIFHTMDGYLDGSMSEWQSGGVNGISPHFNVAGSWDGSAHPDGWINQIRPIDRQAAAQWSGNNYATSIETSDGATEDKVGGWAPAWTDAQLASLIRIAVWWCRTTGNPPVLVTEPTGRGFGYHRQFTTWNQSNHACPGAVREAQLTDVIIPAVQAALNPPTPTTDPMEQIIMTDWYPSKAGYEAMLKAIIQDRDTAVDRAEGISGANRNATNAAVQATAALAAVRAQGDTLTAIQTAVTALTAAVAALTPPAPPSQGSPS